MQRVQKHLKSHIGAAVKERNPRSIVVLAVEATLVALLAIAILTFASVTPTYSNLAKYSRPGVFSINYPEIMDLKQNLPEIVTLEHSRAKQKQHQVPYARVAVYINQLDPVIADSLRLSFDTRASGHVNTAAGEVARIDSTLPDLTKESKRGIRHVPRAYNFSYSHIRPGTAETVTGRVVVAFAGDDNYVIVLSARDDVWQKNQAIWERKIVDSFTPQPPNE